MGMFSGLLPAGEPQFPQTLPFTPGLLYSAPSVQPYSQQPDVDAPSLSAVSAYGLRLMFWLGSTLLPGTLTTMPLNGRKPRWVLPAPSSAQQPGTKLPHDAGNAGRAQRLNPDFPAPLHIEWDLDACNYQCNYQEQMC